ncbi:alpha-ketoglutarate-dependent dioxygenase AlkB [Rhodobacter capsulatus]|uniref:alpha-ketoglutarate-dependent dioxygenase AlkB family protein n=1 Tax=Rhodobacter capsulatus TaxID=1061 RepID=UPI0006DBE53A|nr:alpha-ketoglutarate-dependent dioxygenase AlkB [Rhodobacter capsulatus]KQB11348.1 alkylated DNA repair dioxygenase [Rhodobacter capsulatus]KQB16750.1 alkylated DNA repair dioxygenase [Rhodobacter capsulatus]PZX22893.1 alkylated DNA repair protein (DNA oxidative demethylase) [Rhodobacter capsulatus]QNR63474.1 alpha-ketoglutarate-dependent dioxygenase AlkB [Rhodobacter capsulatus]
MPQSARPVQKRPAPQEIRGFRHYPGWLVPGEQAALVEDLRAVVAAAPLFSPMTPYGRPMSVRMTSAGRFGWVADRRGYRYSETHPAGGAWPAIPEAVLDIWRAVSGSDRSPECCLMNFYAEGARMGLHQDRDEADFSQPVVSISLGDDGLFRIGNETRGGATQSLWLRSGDVLVMGDSARLLYHGIDRIAPGTSTLLPQGGRINLTLRVVT